MSKSEDERNLGTMQLKGAQRGAYAELFYLAAKHSDLIPDDLAALIRSLDLDKDLKTFSECIAFYVLGQTT